MLVLGLILQPHKHACFKACTWQIYTTLSIKTGTTCEFTKIAKTKISFYNCSMPLRPVMRLWPPGCTVTGPESLVCSL